MLWNYFKDKEYFIKRIAFFYDGIRYDGNGIMQWSPSDGFHIVAKVNPEKILPFSKDIGSVDLRPPTRIHMQLDNNESAIVPRVWLNEFELLMKHHVTLNVGRIIFVQTQNDKRWNYWSGSALYELGKKPIFPDTVTKETTIGNSKPIPSFAREGLYYDEPNGEQIIGRLIDDNLFEINWSLPKELWSKNDCRLISEGLKDSLSMLDGQEIKMRVQEIYYGNKYVYEINYGGKPFSLYSILRPFDRDILDKVEIIQLAKFLVRGGEKAKICRNIFRQVADASHQKSWQAGELLLATVLEAILRNLYNQPFIPTQNKRQNSFDLKNYLKRFREEYLSPNIQLGRQWKKVTNQIIQVQRHLRDRNAHPDWLLDQGGEYSNQETETTLNDMVILSRFYGTMIKALAGFENLTPTTYKSVIDWKIMSIQRGTRNPEQG